MPFNTSYAPWSSPCIYCGAEIYQDWVYVRYTCNDCWDRGKEGTMDPLGDENGYENPEDKSAAPDDEDDEDD